ncbi:uncharacterized mitochondrial protein AtMg00810-like [Vicia villosa]|uniref:uncharacterized mitochondrial protein AtMg00810-like n=1 Tax=Vicia villosa TaxID=3911 RepID=UPI00273BD982|nr:uncharacterized mitochondrial protein AtMg00810-like [Vicia villosa]
MDPKSEEGIFLGYSKNNRAYRVFNTRTQVMMESINIVIDDTSMDNDLNVNDNVGTSFLMDQAPRAWYERLTKFLVNNGYKKEGIDKTLFVKENDGKLMIAQIYVDDIVFRGMSDQMVEHFVKQMQSEFEMSLVGELTYFLGLRLKQMDNSIFISQRNYAKNIVKKFGMENASHKRTPAPTHLNLSKDKEGVVVDQSLYRSMIVSLLYLTTSRPNITFAVGVCARYQAEPKTSHINQVKRIFKYINGTSDYEMCEILD